MITDKVRYFIHTYPFIDSKKKEKKIEQSKRKRKIARAVTSFQIKLQTEIKSKKRWK